MQSRWLFCASLTLLLLVVSASYQEEAHSRTAGPTVPDDFPVFYLGAKIARQKLGLLYFPSHQRYSARLIAQGQAGHGSVWDDLARGSGLSSSLHFVAPPFTALLLEPLSQMPWRTAYLVWQMLSALMVVASGYFALRLAAPQPFPTIWPAWAVIVAGALSFFPYLQTQWLGQINALTLLLWTLGTYFIARKKTLASALCFAVATLLKVTPVLAAGLFALRRQWRWLAAYAAWLALLLAISLWRLGVQNHVVWLRFVWPALACGVPYFENRSLPAFVMDIYFHGAALHHVPENVPASVCWLDKGLSAAFYLLILYRLWRKNKDSSGLAYELVLMAGVSLVVSPISWRHHFLLALLPLCFLWITLSRPDDARSNADITILTAATLILGVKAPEYAFKTPILSIAVVGLWLAAALLLIWIGLRMYDRCARVNAASSR